VKLPDVNLLLYAVDETSARHEPARAWLEDRLSGTETFAFAWVVLLAFIRLTTSSYSASCSSRSGRQAT